MLGSLYLSVDSAPVEWFNWLETHRYGVAYVEIHILGQRTDWSKMTIFKTLRMTTATENKRSKLDKTFKKSRTMLQV